MLGLAAGVEQLVAFGDGHPLASASLLVSKLREARVVRRIKLRW